MTFDLAELDALTLAEQGVAMPVIHPRTRMPMMRDDKTPVSITLLGRHSEAFRNTLRRIQEQRAELAGRNTSVSAEQREREDIATLCACTRDWTLDLLDGKPFPCTPENTRRLWNDYRFRWLGEAAMAFILADGNFLAPTSLDSNGGLDSSSSSIARFPTEGARSAPRSEATG